MLLCSHLHAGVATSSLLGMLWGTCGSSFHTHELPLGHKPSARPCWGNTGVLKQNGKVQWCCSLWVKAPENARALSLPQHIPPSPPAQARGRLSFLHLSCYQLHLEGEGGRPARGCDAPCPILHMGSCSEFMGKGQQLPVSSGSPCRRTETLLGKKCQKKSPTCSPAPSWSPIFRGSVAPLISMLLLTCLKINTSQIKMIAKVAFQKAASFG